MYKIPTIKDILEARNIVSRYLLKTPLYYSQAISKLTGAEIYIKFENHQPIGVFKIRGGLVRLHHMNEEEKKRGVITPSTGNHGQSIAYAARTFGVKAVILGPENNNPVKTESMRNLGADVILYGKDFDEAREYAFTKSKEDAMTFIHVANEPHLIAGVGTIGLEIIEDLPDIDIMINPLGGGSSLCGNTIALKTFNPDIITIGVQAEKAPAIYKSWKAGKIMEEPSADTFADGLATRVPFELTFKIIQQMVDDIVLVSEEEMERAILILFKTTRNLAEGAGAASTAAALKLKDRIKGKKVVLLLSGGNLEFSKFTKIIEKWKNFDFEA